MTSFNADMRGDSSDLVAALEKATRAWDRYVQELREAQDVTVKTNKDGKILQATIRNTVAENVKLTRTLTTLKNGTVRQTQSIRDQTIEIERRTRARDAEIAKIKQAAVEAERADRRRGQNVLRGVRGPQTAASLQQAGASQVELINLRRQEGILAELTAKTRLTSKQILAIWRDVARGQTQAFVGSRRRIQEQLLKVLAAQQAIGSEARKAAAVQASAAQGSVAALGRQVRATRAATESAREFTLSWRSLLRILSIQVVSRGFFTLISQLQEATRLAIEFQNAVARVQTIDRANTSFKELSNNLREVSDRFGIDIIDQAAGAYFTLSNQVAEGTEAIRFLTQANKFAIATYTTTEDAVNLLTASINAFGLSIEETNRISAIFFNTIEEGRVTADELANTFGRVAVPAQQLNVSLDEVAALLSVMTINGVKANEAMTFIRNIFLKLIRPGDQMKELFREIGAESGEAAIAIQGLPGLFRILEERTKGSSTEIGNFFQRIRAISGAMLTSGDNLLRFNEILQQSSGAFESFQRAQDIVLGTTAKRLEIALNEIRNFFIEDLGVAAIEGLESLTDGFRTLPRIVEELVNQVKILGIAFITALGVRPLTAVAVGLARVSTSLVAVRTSAAQTRLSLIAVQARLASLRASLVAFARANPFTTLLVAATALVEVVDFIASSTRRTARELAKTAKAVADFAQRENEAVTASLNEQLNLFKIIQRERVRVQTQASSAIVGDLNGLLDEYEEFEEKTAKAAKEANKEVARLLSEQLKDTEKAIKESADRIIAIQERLKQSAVDAQNRILGIDLGEAAGGTEQIKILDQFINRLKEERGKLNLVDPEGFAKISKQIQELQDRRDTIALNAQEEIRDAEAALTELQKQRLKLILDFQKARRSGGTDRSDQLDFVLAISELNEEEEKLVKLIEAERGAASEVEGIRERILERMREEQKLLKESLKFQREQSKELARQEASQIQAQATLKALTERVTEFSFGDVTDAIEEGRPQDARDAVREQNALIQEQIDLQRKLGIATEGSEGTAADRVTSNTARLQAALDRDRFARATKFANQEDETSRKRLAVLQTAERQAREQVTGLDLAIVGLIKKLESLSFGGAGGGGRRVIAPAQDILSSGSIFGKDASILAANSDALNATLANLNRLLDDTSTTEDVLRTIRQLGNIIVEGQELPREERSDEINTFIDGLDKLEKGLIEALRDQGVGARREASRAATEELSTLVEAVNRNRRRQGGDLPDEALTPVQLFAKAQVDVIESQDRLTAALVSLEQEIRGQNAGGREGPGFADGGTVPGGFGGGDRVHALLESGEEVINKDAARSFRSQLKAINSGSMPRFQGGGTVVSTGDFNVSLNASGSTETDVQAIGKALEKEVRLGRVNLIPRRRF